jgi:hypothetical protein
VTAPPAPTVNGAYFGTIGGNAGTFALWVRADGTGVFLGFARAARAALVSREVVIDSDRHFRVSITASGGATVTASTPPVAAADVEYVIDGTIAINGTVSGTVSGGLSGVLAAPAGASTGATASLAGVYQAGASGSSASSLTLIGPAGDAYVLTTSGATADAGKGTINASGEISVTTDNNARVSGTVSAQDSTIAMTLAPATGAAISFGGANNDARTSDEKLANISTRSQTGTTTNTLIAGFVITGDRAKPVLVRAIGPTLGTFGVSGSLPAPRLEIFKSGSATAVATGNDWGSASNATAIAAAATRVGAFALGTTSRDAALLLSLEPGAYSAVVTSQTTASGIALVEVYDATEGGIPRNQRIINIATRATAGAGENALIAGFVINGTVPKRVLVRGIGPTLGQFGVTGALTRPLLTINSGATELATNSGWSTSADAATIATESVRVGAFALGATSQDAAIVIYLQPGAYTASVTGVGGATGVALIEVYELP